MHVKTSNRVFSLGFGPHTCDWGTHICGFYQHADDRDEITLAFFGKGVEQGDRLLYVGPPAQQDALLQGLAERWPDRADTLVSPQVFTRLAPEAAYYPDGSFSPYKMERNLDAFLTAAEQTGPFRLRSAGEMTWAQEAVPGREHLMAYEARVNRLFEGRPWVTICWYDVRLMTGQQLMDALRTHPMVISKGILTQNPYYQDPKSWLEENAPEFV